MSGINEVRIHVESYRARYKLKGLKFSDVYDLELDWNEKSYPFANDPGVYIVLDKKEFVLYVGKASFNSNIGARLGSYFEYGENRSFAVKSGQHWTEDPKFVVAIKVSAAYEAPSLEEYLIRQLDPPDNTQKYKVCD